MPPLCLVSSFMPPTPPPPAILCALRAGWQMLATLGPATEKLVSRREVRGLAVVQAGGVRWPTCERGCGSDRNNEGVKGP